jgi:hypothetical protein
LDCRRRVDIVQFVHRMTANTRRSYCLVTVRICVYTLNILLLSELTTQKCEVHVKWEQLWKNK